MFKKTLLAVAMGLSIVTMSACSDDDDDHNSLSVPEQEQEQEPTADDISLLEAVKSRDDLTIMASLIEAGKLGELESNLRGYEYTLFLPSDAALMAYAAGEGYSSVDEFMNDSSVTDDMLRRMFLYHALREKFAKDDIELGKTLTPEAAYEFDNAYNVELVINKSGEDYFITDTSKEQDNTSKIIAANIETKDDIIHVIDDVLEMSEKQIPTQSIADIVIESDDFTILEQALTETGLASTFAGSDNYTVFAPTDAAFNKLASDLGVEVTDLLTDKDKLADILKYHVVAGAVSAIDVPFGADVKTLNDKNITITQDGDGMMVTDLSGDTDNMADITMPNIMATNGVIHVIDDVLLPMSLGTDTNTPVQTTVVTTLENDPQLSTLYDIVKAQNLLGDLEAGNLTIFAPTNDAFDAFFKATGYSKPLLMSAAATSQVKPVIKYHVVPTQITSDTLVAGELNTANGAKLTINADKKVVDSTGAAATIVAGDIEASDGVIHKIDKVLIPPRP